MNYNKCNGAYENYEHGCHDCSRYGKDCDGSRESTMRTNILAHLTDIGMIDHEEHKADLRADEQCGVGRWEGEA